ncbi:hypothetical protein COCCADRAFT_94110, partial [Bipolaris zeicola 26-R-13]
WDALSANDAATWVVSNKQWVKRVTTTTEAGQKCRQQASQRNWSGAIKPTFFAPRPSSPSQSVSNCYIQTCRRSGCSPTY